MTEIGEVRKLSSERIVSKIGEKKHEHKASSNSPIGMFDSGVGGLTVLREVIKILPGEDVLYFADTGRVPYGGRSPQEIININHELIDYLIDQGAKIIIMACGTSSSIAFSLMKEKYKLPIVGLVGPGAAAAVRASMSGKIGIIATVGTVESGAFKKEIISIKPGAEVYAQGCPLFVPLIEGGFTEAEETKRAAKEYLEPLIKAKIDALILGCTHYPHLEKIIREIVGPGVTLVDPAIETVKEASDILKKKSLLSDRTGPPTYSYFISGSVPQFKDLGSKLLGKPIVSAKKVTLIAKKGPIK